MANTEPRPSLTYSDAGVDVARGAAAVDGIRKLAQSTFTPGVLSDIGSFGGLFRLDTKAFDEPVLVASTDGVGTKVKVATAVGRHDTVGEDLVNHCVNDILVQGAAPLFFLDYFATDHLSPEVLAEVVEGIARGCRAGGAALLGGETAEMPGVYRRGEYDLAGTIIGVVDRKNVIDGSRIEPGDILLGLPSDGLHTNGYSLARKALLEVGGVPLRAVVPELNETLADALLRVHRSYLEELRKPLAAGYVRGLAHITGGGITENLPRVLPSGCAARVRRSAWRVPPLFQLIARHGGVVEAEMLRSFNMGIGMIVITSAADRDRALTAMPEATEIGEVIATTGAAAVEYEP